MVTLFHFLKILHAVFHSGCPILHSYEQCTFSGFLHILSNICFILKNTYFFKILLIQQASPVIHHVPGLLLVSRDTQLHQDNILALRVYGCCRRWHMLQRSCVQVVSTSKEGWLIRPLRRHYFHPPFLREETEAQKPEVSSLMLNNY